MTWLSDLPFWINGCTTYMTERIEKKAKILLINSLHKPPAWFGVGIVTPDPAVTAELFQFSSAEPVAYEGN